MTEKPPKVLTDRDKAELILKLTKEAQFIEKRLGAQACIVICFFENGKEITVQDAGCFPMPPDDFYEVMVNAHRSGALAPAIKTKGPARILKPN